ncbi:MAG: hypothetical protein QG553_922 [Patescibacteria group bacterium]|nr:hypothetical protein [Patescibacteria group bacterium]
MTHKKLTPEQLRSHKGISFTGVTTAFICYDKDGRIFVAQRSKNARDEHGRWDCGGGGLKHGQSLEENVRREVKEEYGADVKKLEFLGYLDIFRETPDGKPTHWLAMYFAALVDPKQVKICEPEMVDDSGWFALDSFPSPMHSYFPKFMDAFGEKLRTIITS